jgi:TetR/AcrR family transcriptional regulator
MTGSDIQTEEKIFRAATEVFVEKGMDGARMQDIATRAGINKALLHYYFRTKEQLFNTVFELIARQVLKKFAPVFEEGRSLEDKIRFFFREHISFLQQNPRLPVFILNEINRHPDRIRKLVSQIDFRQVNVLLQQQHGHELHKYDITEEKLPQLMTTIASMSVFPFAARGLIKGILENSGVDWDNYIEERKVFAAEFVINSIRKKDIF